MFFDFGTVKLPKKLPTPTPVYYLPYTTAEPDIVNFFTRFLREKRAFSET